MRGGIEALLGVLAVWALVAHFGTLVTGDGEPKDIATRAALKLIPAVLAIGFLGLMFR